MATTLHRISITETPEVAHWIDIAAVTYPELLDDRGAALRRIIEIGGAAIERQQEERVRLRREAIRKHAGSMAGVFPPNAAQRLKEEWPE